ncbi:MAG: hypothetical protein KDB14_31065 [Planctomycetales bacterium]|nr:hypothetical protein [Planctomycetales bacterium]
MRKKSNNRHIGRFEKLEDRNMMAVNVQDFSNSVSIYGDQGDDEIQIYSIGTRLIRVQGLNGTQVDGGTHVDVPLSFYDDLRISMGDGQNRVWIAGQGGRSVWANNVSIWGGSDDDIVEVEQLFTQDDLSIITWSGNDTVRIVDSVFGDRTFGTGTEDLDIQTWAGHNVVYLGNVTSTRGMSIESSFGDSSRISLQQVDAKFGSLSVSGTDGDDSLSAFDVRAGESIHIDLGDGDDYAGLYRMDAHRTLSIDTGDGNDQLSLMASEAQRLLINMGSDSDRAELHDVHVWDSMNISMGDGDDRLSIYSSTGGRAAVHGGEGSDFLEAHDNVFANFAHDGFETAFDLALPKKATLTGTLKSELTL